MAGDAVSFLHNEAGRRGGAIQVGGGALNPSRPLCLDNQAPRGGAQYEDNAPSVHLINVIDAILARDEGEGAIYLKNSIVSDNPDGNCGFRSGQVRVQDVGNNLQFGDASCGVTIPVIDPRLDSSFYAENRKTQSVFACVACGHTEHADIHAAKIIQAAGHAAWARERASAQGPAASKGAVRRPRGASRAAAAPAKQEPTEARAVA